MDNRIINHANTTNLDAYIHKNILHVDSLGLSEN